MVLFVETSSERGGLLLLRPSSTTGQDWFSVEWRKQASHSEVITAQFEALLQKSSADAAEISEIAVNVGPGSFTGIRVGLSFATTLAYLRKLPMVSFNSLELMAAQSKHEGKILVSLPAIKGHHYTAAYKIENGKLEEIMSPRSQSDAEIEKLKSDHDFHVDGRAPETRPKVETMADFHRRKTRLYQKTAWNAVQPLYLRRSEAEEKLRTGLLKPVYGESEQQFGSTRDKKDN